MNEPAKKAKSKSTLKGISLVGKLVMAMISVAMFTISFYAFLLLLLGMMPGIVAMFIDKRKDKFASGTVSCWNFIGISPFLLQIWNSSSPAETAQPIMFNISFWLITYGAAGFGSVMLWLMPQLGMAWQLLKADMIINNAKSAQKSLIEEWGQDIDLGKRKST